MISTKNSRNEKNSMHIGVATAIAGNGIKGRPKTGKETKIRVNFALLPSLYEKIKKVAYIKRISVSEILEECFERYLKENPDGL